MKRPSVFVFLLLVASVTVSCAGPAASTASPVPNSSMIQPGDTLGEAVLEIAKDETGEPDVFTYCSPIIAESDPRVMVRTCKVPQLPYLFIGYAELADTQEELESLWAKETWQLSFDEHPVNLGSFGVFDTEWEGYRMRRWKIAVENLPPGEHSLRYIIGSAGSQEPLDVTWVFTITSAPPISTLITSSVPTVNVEHPSSPKKMLLIYDDDGSRDGMAALLYFLSYPDISIQAINISYGEAHPKLYIQHVGRVFDKLGINDIPLGAGQDMPLAGGTPFPDWLRQLSDNFWDYPLPNTDKTYPFQNAPELMVSIIGQAPEPVTIFLSGPFTNLAQALHLDSAIKGNISAVYFMGGAVYVPGNITNLMPDSNNRVADWNMIADPQAAKEVFESGLEIYMVPLDATNKVLLSQEDILPWRQGDDKANMVVDLYDIMFNTWGLNLAEIFDLTAAVLMVQSESCNFQPLHLEVITDDGPILGQTIVVPNTEPNIHVCLEPNADQVKQNLNETFAP